MKKTFSLLFALGMLSSSFFTSCSSCSSNKEKPREERVAEFRSTLNHEDTTQMLKLCDSHGPAQGWPSGESLEQLV